eukprot:TRINITY_DN845_c1_g2_i1.p1 TRINITY_DN845_c1_g2~~TRINITY_DN845_c1_g2_i1.p1  ORF type:complete len:279 (+),score=34.69 TRINITY_DN845_c1_g2_i1:302-1138(+)
MWESDVPRLRALCGRERGTSLLMKKQCGSVEEVPTTGNAPVEVVSGDRITLDVEDHPFEVSFSPLGTTPPPPPPPPKLVFPTYNNTRMTAGPPSLHALKIALTQLRDKQPSEDARVFYNNGTHLFIYDAFPKSQFHMLGFCLRVAAATPSDLTTKDLEDVKTMHQIGHKIGKSIAPDVEWQVGYHATPSLHPLHCHVMSTDLSSSCMKNKKHYVSFVQPNFIPAQEIERRLESGQPVVRETDKADCGLRCRWCSTVLPNMPKLKTHLAICRPFDLKTV